MSKSRYRKDLKKEEISAANLGYIEFRIENGSDTIYFYLYNPENVNKKYLFLYLQGSVDLPLYSYRLKADGIISIVSTIPFNLNKIPEDYAFVTITKAGLPFAQNETVEDKTPKQYYLRNTLNERTARANKVLNYLLDNQIVNDLSRIVVLGHSEGADVAARLAVINGRITHIGYWSSDGATQLYDFPLRTLRKYYLKEITFQQMKNEMNVLFDTFKQIFSDNNSIDKFWEENTFLRWSTFSAPPIDNLLKVNVPIFVAIGSQDEAVAIENTYLIPIEFIRHRKDNLTFKIYENYNHSFEEVKSERGITDHWDDVTEDFLDWIEKHS